jgi:hypothetical protein
VANPIGHRRSGLRTNVQCGPTRTARPQTTSRVPPRGGGRGRLRSRSLPRLRLRLGSSAKPRRASLVLVRPAHETGGGGGLFRSNVCAFPSRFSVPRPFHRFFYLRSFQESPRNRCPGRYFHTDRAKIIKRKRMAASNCSRSRAI